MKVLRVAVLLGMLGALLFAVVPASADGGYCSQPGCPKALENTECAGHGAFGAFGDKGDIGIHDFGHVYPGDSNGKPGANGDLTGDNNSHLCGNPQN